MTIKCPKCNKSDGVVCDDGPYFDGDDGIYADFVCEECSILFRAEFAIELYEEEILEENVE